MTILILIDEKKEEKTQKNNPNEKKIKKNGDLETDSDLLKRLNTNLKAKEARFKKNQELKEFNDLRTIEMSNRYKALNEEDREVVEEGISKITKI